MIKSSLEEKNSIGFKAAVQRKMVESNVIKALIQQQQQPNSKQQLNVTFSLILHVLESGNITVAGSNYHVQ